MTASYNKITKNLEFKRIVATYNSRTIEVYNDENDKTNVDLVMFDFDAMGKKSNIKHKKMNAERYQNISDDIYNSYVEYSELEDFLLIN